MTTVGRLQDGDFLTAGEIDEVASPIKNGLVATYPLIDTLDGIDHDPIVNYDTWTLGSGSTPGFNQNGSTNENHRIMGTDPWGNTRILWEARPDGNNNADGGWNTTRFPVDPSLTYRFSVWVNRTVMGSSGSFYIGLNAYGGTNGVMSAGTTNISTNPYFYSGRNLPQNEWVLAVAHVHPSWSNTAKHADTGFYNTKGEKIAEITRDYKWLADTREALHRTFLYYATDTVPRQRWCCPRVDVIGTHAPTIAELITGEAHVIKNDTNIISAVFTPEGAASAEAMTNLIPESGQDFEWGGYASAALTTTQNYPVAEWNTASATRLQTTGGTNVIKVVKSFVTAPAENRRFSVSVRVKNMGSKPVSVNSNQGGGFGTIAPGKAQYCRTGNIPGNGRAHIQIQFRAASAADGIDIVAFEPQIEENPYPTAFSATGRPRASSVSLTTRRYQTYTVFGTFDPMSAYSNGTYDTTKNGAELLRILDGEKRGHLAYRYWLSGTNSSPYLDLEGYYMPPTGNGHYHQTYQLSAFDKIHYAIRKSGTSIRIKLYQNGAWQREHAGTCPIDAGIDGISFSGSGWNGTHSDIMLYNRSLSDAELDRLSGRTFSLNKAGDLVGHVSEYPSISIIDDMSKTITNNQYLSFGTWTVDDKDLTPFLEDNHRLGNVYFMGEVYISSLTYYPTRFEFTRENNIKGINQSVAFPRGGWKVGWNDIFFKITTYNQEAATPWDDMSRFEVYRSGPAANVDTSQSIRLKNIQIVKIEAPDTWMRSSKEETKILNIVEGESL